MVFSHDIKRIQPTEVIVFVVGMVEVGRFLGDINLKNTSGRW